MEIYMKINKIKLALGLVAGLSVAMPMIASAAADQEKAIASSDNWAAPRGDYSNQAYSKLTQINQGNVKNLKAALDIRNRCKPWSRRFVHLLLVT